MLVLPPDASDEAIWEVTRWPQPRARVEVMGMVEYDLPINGVWSDLTAIFWLRRMPDGLALELYDIHIL